MKPAAVRAWAFALLLAALAAASWAEDTPGKKFLAQRLAKVARQAAARVWEAADRARRDSLFRFARAEAQRVLELDPDHRAARLFLGYLKKGEAWEIDLGASQKSPTENLAAGGGPALPETEAAWRSGALRRADLDVAALYAALGDECAGKGFKNEADAAYAMALALDRDSAAAHRGLGHVPFADWIWLTAEANRAYAAASGVRPLSEASRYDEMLRTSLNKAESGHFRVESPHAPSVVAGYLGACEKAFAAYCADLGVDFAANPFPRQPLFCATDTEEQWDLWVNHETAGNPGFWRSRAYHWARDRWACATHNLPGQTDLARRDRMAHESVHMLNLAVWGMPDGLWLDDALAYRYCIAIEGTTTSFCLLPKKAGYAEASSELDWTNPRDWRDQLKAMVARKDDLALRVIVNKRSYDLPLLASVKAWSVVDFLMRRDRPAFLAYLREQKSEGDRILMLETRFGKDVESLDEAWRSWVRETY